MEESRLKPRSVLSLTPPSSPTMRNQNAHKRSWRTSRCISGEMCVSCIQVNSSFGFRVDGLSYQVCYVQCNDVMIMLFRYSKVIWFFVR